MPSLDTVEFKWKIGDIVTHAGFVRGSTVRGLPGANLERFLIVGRVAEECPGGVQLHYRVRVVIRTYDRTSTSSEITSFNEIELADLPQPDDVVGTANSAAPNTTGSALWRRRAQAAIDELGGIEEVEKLASMMKDSAKEPK